MLTTLTNKDRLRKGAAVLGDLWRSGEKCPDSWKALEDCSCIEKGKFCKAKTLWITLAYMEGRIPDDGDSGIMDMMTGSEWDATKLTVKFEIPEHGVIAVGVKGVLGRLDMLKLTPDTLGSILRVAKSFPGIKVQSVAEPVPVAAVVSPETIEEDIFELNGEAE